MPPRKRNSRRRNCHSGSSEDSDEEVVEYTPPQSQSQSQSQNLTALEIEKAAGRVCNMLLCADRKKIPTKRFDIMKNMIKMNKSSFQKVMNVAEEQLKHVFGYKIVSLNGYCYILVNTMGDKFSEVHKVPKNELVTRGVLVTILIAIFMSEGKISAGALTSCLSILDLDMTTVKNFIQDYIRKKYLITTTLDSSDPPTVMYQWGERANAEFSKKDMLEFVCKVYGNNMKPSVWVQQWKAIQENNDD